MCLRGRKLLSFAGKEILIKSVLLAVPIYPMMCFKIPESVCKRMSGIIHRFWWSHKAEERAIFWVRSACLYRSKADGGLNFRVLELVNDALLAKQYWKLLSDPSALVSRIFRAKYYKDSDISSSQLGYRPSFVWRSIWNAGRRLSPWMVVNSDGRPVWCLETHGSFSVSSAYRKLVELQQVSTVVASGECSDKRESEMFWKAVWRMRLQNKFKFFLWRLFHNALPIALNLRRRGIALDIRCQICGFKVESSDHIFLKCWWAKYFWSELGFPHCWESFSFDTVKEWLWFCFKSYPAESFALVCYGASMIWRNRNLVNHNGKGLNVGHVSAVSKNRVSSCYRPSFKFSVIGFDSSLSWVAPTGPVVKVNCDGSVQADANCADFSKNVSDSVEAEGLAVLLALKWALRSRFKDCIIETDCAEVFSLIHCYNGWNDSSRIWLAECAEILSKNGGWYLSLSYREANATADGLARKAARDEWQWSNLNAIPIWIKKLL